MMEQLVAVLVSCNGSITRVNIAVALDIYQGNYHGCSPCVMGPVLRTRTEAHQRYRLDAMHS